MVVYHDLICFSLGSDNMRSNNVRYDFYDNSEPFPSDGMEPLHFSRVTDQYADKSIGSARYINSNPSTA